MMGDTLVVIPARYASSRFPGKPLADLCGKPMIQHVWERAMQAKQPNRVVVATDDERIAQCVRSFGGACIMTAASHRTGTERVAEVAAASSSPLVVNLQGDLPFFQPATLDRLIEVGRTAILGGQTDVVTARARLDREEEIFSPSSVKVVSDASGRALYFSRAPIPHVERAAFASSKLVFYKHYGIYIYGRAFLLASTQLPEGVLEAAEQLEQLRVLEHGGNILAVEIAQSEAHFFWEVNHPADLVRAAALLAEDGAAEGGTLCAPTGVG